MSRRNRTVAILIFGLAALDAAHAQTQDHQLSAEERAAATEQAMTPDERVVLTHGDIAFPYGEGFRLPPGALYGAGFVGGIERLHVPALRETDASLGVSFLGGLRGDGGATALPSGTAMGATWNPTLVERGGAMIGSEARAKGFNILLAGGVNLVREPRNGRTFEYFAEDPLLSGMLAGAAIAGVQSNHVISTVKHFALNAQETGRHFVDAGIDEPSLRESDLLAFQIAIERGKPGAVMCAYNQVNGAQACGNDFLLNRVLKREWGYKGFVMSDWGAVHGLDFALKGLDQQSGAQLDPALYFGAKLRDAAAQDRAFRARLSDMNRRILYAIYANGLDAHPPTPGQAIDRAANAAVAEQVAKEAIVLLRNRQGALPLAGTVRRIAVIGGYADSGVLSGGGSSQVHLDGGAAATVSYGGTGPFAGLLTEQYQRALPPLAAIRARAPQAEIHYRNGAYISEAVEEAKRADVVILFANQWQSEGIDSPDLSLPRGQDALIWAVAEANPNTVVVLQTGSAVTMPWLGKTAAVLEAWYPGARGGEAIASVLFGETNPSGRLPITFPTDVAQLPRPELDGSSTVDPDFLGKGAPGQTLSVNYAIEGADVGYRWNARKAQKALFPFGFGLSYTSFVLSDLKIAKGEASFTVRNTGARAGAAVAQVYLVSTPSGLHQRLVGFEKVMLAPGESRTLNVALDRRLLADWQKRGWTIAAGNYGFALGASAEDLGPTATVRLEGERWRP